FLNPIIERVYSVLDRAGVFPPVDDEELLDQLNGQEVKIEYISPLAQAQKMSSLVNIEQYFAFIMSLAQANPNIVNKF
ncbi:portal protein, partial [Enterococcus faecium]